MSDQKRITYYLVTRVGDEPAQALIWDTIEITVGRLETQDIVLFDPEISREHAVFRKRDDLCSVEDLDSTLGVLVNGNAIKEHELRPGDDIRIGPLTVQFGQSEEPMRRGPNVRFASELKGFALPSGADGGGTMLALTADEDPLPTVSPVATPSAARTVSASGELSILQDDISVKGHAFECRINAEDENFNPGPGTVSNLEFPGGPGVRVDSHLYNGYDLPHHYDSLVAKLIVSDVSRAAALKRMQRALGEFSVKGIESNVDLHKRIFGHEQFALEAVDTNFLQQIVLKG